MLISKRPVGEYVSAKIEAKPPIMVPSLIWILSGFNIARRPLSVKS